MTIERQNRIVIGIAILAIVLLMLLAKSIGHTGTNRKTINIVSSESYRLDMNHFDTILCDSLKYFKVIFDTNYSGLSEFNVADDFASSYITGSSNSFLEEEYELRIIEDYDGSKRGIIIRTNY